MSESQITPEELKALIEQTYKVEEEYISLRQTYTHLQATVEQVIEFLPNPIWVLEENGTVFLANSKANELHKLLENINLQANDYEIRFGECSFLVKIGHHNDRYLVSATDITEQKRKENLATMGQMAAHLSHEIRNPIGSISLLTSTLKKRVIDENLPIVEEIEKSVSRIERIVKATLLFSKGISAHMKPLRFSTIREALQLAIGYYSYTKDIRFSFPEHDFIIRGDLELLNMLFSNFFFNAIDAIEMDDEEEGRVDMSYENDGSFHIFSIYDSGIAIEDKNLLFEAFKSTKEKGNGLGLVLSSQIAAAHGGSVILAPGDEKRFIIRLKI